MKLSSHHFSMIRNVRLCRGKKWSDTYQDITNTANALRWLKSYVVIDGHGVKGKGKWIDGGQRTIQWKKGNQKKNSKFSWNPNKFLKAISKKFTPIIINNWFFTYFFPPTNCWFSVHYQPEVLAGAQGGNFMWNTSSHEISPHQNLPTMWGEGGKFHVKYQFTWKDHRG